MSPRPGDHHVRESVQVRQDKAPRTSTACQAVPGLIAPTEENMMTTNTRTFTPAELAIIEALFPGWVRGQEPATPSGGDRVPRQREG